MNTELFEINDENRNTDASKEAIERAGKILQGGGLVAFPTETVYGLGGDALNPESSRKIYAAKGRPSDNPLIVHICRWEDLSQIVKEIPETAKRLADAFWPGPLTMILEKSDKVPGETTGGLSTVAVRMPDDQTALALIRAAGGFIAAPSANVSGRPSPTLAKYVQEDLGGKVEMILDGGQACIGLESTIVDLTDKVPTILRPGYITKEMLSEILGEVETDRAILPEGSSQTPKAPGMKYRHYAPKAELTIIAGEEKAVIRKINELVAEAEKKGLRSGVIATETTMARYNASLVKNAGSREKEETVAKELYRILREFDEEEVDVIYSESFAESGIGQAVMNRLLKAAGHRVEEAGEP
ncbi:MAG: threonylcarbamoyl-AMP synthase [Lachnospiraceae bacterium]|nr:threonylcarbamoyl-AMP synthase [Lachnospiraceae bacterium]